MRSFARYYTLRSGRLRNKKNGSSQHGDQSYNKRGRKREWRKKLDDAKSLNDFLQIEIQEPPTVDSVLSSSSSSSPKEASNNKNDSSSSSSSPSFSSSNVGSIFRRSTFLSSSSSPSASSSSTHKSSSLSPTSNGSSTLRKIKSYCESPSRPNRVTSSSSSSKNDDKNTPISSNNSINQAQIHRSKSNIEISQLNKNNPLPANHVEIERELGMTGTMLLQTTYRLKEARMQATANYKAMSYLSSWNGNSAVSTKNKAVSSINESHHEDDDDHEGHFNSSEMNGSLPSSFLNLSNNGHHQQQLHENNAASQLKFLLQGVVKRNHLSINDLLIQDALSVMESGRHHLSEQSRNVIFNYHEEVEECLKWIADCGLEKNHYQSNNYDHDNNLVDDSDSNHLPGGVTTVTTATTSQSNLNGSSYVETEEIKLYKELTDRRNLIRKLKHNMGRTALMLSGGGAQAMYHLGTIKALCESKLYDDISVISGTSGGSITAAMCATKTREELLADVCVPHVSTDYGLTGQMKKENIRWFPTVLQMGEYWLKHKLLVDPTEFKRCCDFYFGDITFEEAFERTGKHVCITVSASRMKGGGEGGGAQRLLLNHISTPHVTIASAVAASCALPGGKLNQGQKYPVCCRLYDQL